MLKKLLLSLVLAIGATFAYAQVEANKADQAALDGVKGIGPKMSKAILDERKKGGDFKDWADFEARVKGVGQKNAVRLSEAGLTVNGQSLKGAADKEEKSKSAAKGTKKDSKSESKK